MEHARAKSAQKAPGEPAQTALNATVKKLSLHAALPQQVLIAQLENGLIAEPADQQALLAAWVRASTAYANCGPPSRSFITARDLRPLKGVAARRPSATLKRIRTYPPFDTHVTDLYDVPVSKLVTPQITLNVARAASRSVKGRPNASTIFRLAFEDSGPPSPINRQVLGMQQNAASVLFTSFDEDVRLHHPPVYQDVPLNKRDPASQLLQAICLLIGGGPSFITAFRVTLESGDIRLVVTNGIHRLHSLAKAGVTRVPIAICDLQSLEIPDPLIELPKQFVCDARLNPPLITDFLNPQVVIELDYFKLLKTVRLNWNFEQYATVLK